MKRFDKNGNRNYKKLSKKQLDFLEIYQKNLGLLTPSCKASLVTTSTVYSWKQNPNFMEKFIEARLSLKDFGESALFQLIKQKNPAAVIFFNKTINKDRGYVEKQEIEYLNEPVQINVIIPESVKKLLGD